MTYCFFAFISVKMSDFTDTNNFGIKIVHIINNHNIINIFNNGYSGI